MSNNNEKLTGSISKIGEEERKKLFNNFVSSGGQVDAKNNTKNTVKPNSHNNKKAPISNKSYSNNTSKNNSKVSGAYSNQEYLNAVLSISEQKIELLKKRSQLKGFASLEKRARAFLSGVTNLGGSYIQHQFYIQTIKLLTVDLVSLKSVTKSVVESSLFTRADLLKSFYNTSPIFTEVILRMNALKFQELGEKYSQYKEYTLKSSRVYYLHLIKLFFPFIGKEETVRAAYFNSFRVLKQLKTVNLEFIKKEELRAKQLIDNIYHYISKLEKLYPLMIGYNINIVSPISKSILELTRMDILGAWKEQIENLISKAESKMATDGGDDSSAEDESDEQKQLRLLLQDTMEFIYNIPFSNAIFNSDISNYPKTDKLFAITYLLDYATRRFAILQNKRVFEYQQQQEHGERFSIEVIIDSFFNSIGQFHIGLKNYTQIMTRLNHFAANAHANSNPLAPISKEEENLLVMRSKMSKQLRDQVIVILQAVIKPFNNKHASLHSYLRDPNEEISGAILAGHQFRLSKQINIVENFYHYILGVYQLISQGELAGAENVNIQNTELNFLREASRNSALDGN